MNFGTVHLLEGVELSRRWILAPSCAGGKENVQGRHTLIRRAGAIAGHSPPSPLCRRTFSGELLERPRSVAHDAAPVAGRVAGVPQIERARGEFPAGGFEQQ